MSPPESSKGTATSTLNESALAENRERARQWLQQVLSAMGIPASVQVVGEAVEIEAASLTAAQKQLLLSKAPPLPRELGHEEDRSPVVLDALQYLANTLLNLNQPEGQQQAYTLELDGYRQRRLQELQDMATAAVEQVRASGQEYEFQALSAAERRQIHTLLGDPTYGDLETFSRGKEPDRRLVIRPVSEGAK
ncbi:MAG: R3H domain-containing nucleic acid-binding protein [Thermostichus sp. DG02_5_bins_236]